MNHFNNGVVGAGTAFIKVIHSRVSDVFYNVIFFYFSFSPPFICLLNSFVIV